MMKSLWYIRLIKLERWYMRPNKGAYRRDAEEDLEQLLYNKKDGFRLAKSSCVHAQQYAEKMIKDKIVDFDVDPQKIHDLVTLLFKLSDISSTKIDDDILFLAGSLSRFYISLRYPCPEPITASPEDAENAFEWAIEIVDWVDRNIKSEKQ